MSYKEQGCFKIAYNTPLELYNAMKKRNLRGNAYKCEICGFYHWTSLNKTTSDRIKKSQRR